MSEFIPIFPTTLYKAQSNLKLSDTELSVLSKWEGNPSTFGNTQSTNSNVLNIPELALLKELCQHHLEVYYRQVVSADENTEIYITDSWINFAGKGDTHTMHTHVNSILSGVLYLQVDDSVPSIIFNKLEPFFTLEVPVTEQTVYNSPQWELEVHNGDIVVFPSNVWHNVKANNSDSPRVTLAFNSFVKGNIGHPLTGKDVEL